MNITLEQSIAAALADNDIASSDLAALITEVEAAVTAADEAATEAREQALDPIASPDPNKARASMEAAAFTRDRLRTVLPRLRQRLKEVCSQEAYAHWVAQYEAIKIKRDAAAAELRTLYPEIVSKLVDLLSRIEVIDREVERVRSAKPFDAKEANGDGRNLLETELTARGLDHFTVHDQQIMKDLKLPDFEQPSKLSWPPPPPPINYANLVQVRPHPGGDWWRAQQEDATRRRAEFDRREEELRQEEARRRNNPAA